MLPFFAGLSTERTVHEREPNTSGQSLPTLVRATSRVFCIMVRFHQRVAHVVTVSLAVGCWVRCVVAARQAPAEPSSAAAVAADVLGAMDRSVAPCQDFFRYSCGGFLDAAVIPPKRHMVGRSLDAIEVGADAWLASVLHDGELRSTRAGRFYAACLSGSATTPQLRDLRSLLRADLRLTVNETTGATTEAEVLRALAVAHASGIGGDLLWRLEVELDVEVGVPVPKLRPPSLTLTAAEFAGGGSATSAAHRSLATTMLGAACRVGWLSHCGNATLLAARVKDAVEFEGFLASEAAARSVGVKVYSSDVAFLRTYLGHLNIRDPDGVVLLHRNYFNKLNSGFANPEVLRALPAYLTYAATLDLARSELLGPDLYTAWTRFERVARPADAENRRTMRARCVRRTAEALPDELSAAYVRRNVVPADTAAMGAIASQSVTAAGALLNATTWLDGPSRAAAQFKLTNLQVNNGADPAHDPYADVVVRQGARRYAANTASAAAAAWRRRVARLTSDEAAARWRRPAFRIDASYAALGNTATVNSVMQRWPVLPSASAAARAPLALAYGSAGYIASHEVGHAFDPQGVRFDGFGLQNPWLSAASGGDFLRRLTCLANKYARYNVTEAGGRLSIDGVATLQENVADVIGARVAHAAFASALASTRPSRRVADTNAALARVLNDQQLFFVALAQTWCVRRTPASLRQLLQGGVHAPERYRVRGALSELPAFAAAFDCPVGAVYRPSQTCGVYGE